MISRRSLLTGMSLLPLAGGIVGCAARASGLAANTSASAANSSAVASGPPPTVGPGPRWNGAPLSGGTPPADPVRTTAKPAIHWLIPSDLRLVSNLTMGVDADANGGVKQVDFWVEGQVQTVTAPSIYTDTDANGASRSRYGYWITLNASAFKIISTTGEARIYATAVPNDTTMQNRVIGYDLVNNGLYDGNYPMSVFPRAVANDWSKTVRLDGTGDFTSLRAALDAARAAAPEAPLITITQTGFYELASTNAATPINYANGKGFLTITHAPGVIATCGRASAFIPNNPGSWPWFVGWSGVEFRGSGIVLDVRNWTTINSDGQNWGNGCKITNSIGTRDSYYWNGGPHPGIGGFIYVDDVYAEFIWGDFQQSRYAINTKIKQTGGDIFSGTHYVYGSYVRDYSSEFFRAAVPGLSITYGNPGGHSAATVSKSGVDAAGGGGIVLTVDGAPTTIPCGFYATDTNPTVQHVANAINALGSGWSATVLNGKGAFRASAMSNFSTTTALGTTVPVTAAFDIHGDWWQGYSGANNRENVIIRNNVCRDAVNVNSALFNDDAVNGGYSLDHIVKGNVWLGGYGTTSVGFAKMSHYVFENNTHSPWLTRNEVAGADTVYCSVKNNILGAVATAPSFNMPQTQDAPLINNLYMIPNGASAISGGRNGGNFTYPNPGDNTGTTFTALFVNYAAGDVRPVAAGVLLSNLKPRANIADALGSVFAAADVVGARSMNAPAPNYPF